MYWVTSSKKSKFPEIMTTNCSMDSKILSCYCTHHVQTRTPVYLSHTPAGTSSMNVMHWVQMVKKGTVAMYDYGTRENKKKYGQANPPEYDFTKIQKPIYLYCGDDDWLADPQDISGYLLPRISHTVVENVELTDYNHLDFIWGLRAAADIYYPIVEKIKEDLA
ncbi:hypothetical protein ANCDUO_24019 [Ancylostoma duodenale]|uniref:AB hydrolase-1 domain-containing protein n=1 Tax=Ancylostoma duodenale TaxID=51022 RepID=A0A0C2FM60_9BILA|nr:hypothetical protein ANCDUO_24019 [Ancylostoma duodenale]